MERKPEFLQAGKTSASSLILPTCLKCIYYNRVVVVQHPCYNILLPRQKHWFSMTPIVLTPCLDRQKGMHAVREFMGCL